MTAVDFKTATEPHAAAGLFPMLGDDELAALVADIREHGQLEPIQVVDGVLVDGRNRLRACEALGIEPKVRHLTLAEAGDVHARVMSLNFHRRHLRPHERGAALASFMDRVGAKKQPGRRTDVAPSATSCTLQEVAERLGIDPSTATRSLQAHEDYRTASDEQRAKVDAGEITPAQARAATEGEPAFYGRLQRTGSVDWYTPAMHVELARKVLGAFDLDPASNDIAQKRIRAERYYTVEDDGLAKPWRGRVWLNPPYAQPAIEQFIRKLVAEVEAQHVTAAVLLTHNYTDTAWFHVAAGAANALCFTRGRISFERPDGRPGESPAQGQVFFYFGPHVDRFDDVFREIGLVIALPPSLRQEGAA